jgi:membrane protein DedA with SNARE-associated domain
MSFILEHGYTLIFLLAVVEGPISTLVAGDLASLGYFSLPWVIAAVYFGEIVGDLAYYYVGRSHNRPVVKKYGRYLGLSPQRIQTLKSFFATSGGRIVFLAKATLGFGTPVYVTAGIVRMHILRFLLIIAIAGAVRTAVLIIVGYFFGTILQEVSEYIRYVSIVVATLFIGAYLLYSRRAPSKIERRLEEHEGRYAIAVKSKHD